jgi:hypothetical protein
MLLTLSGGWTGLRGYDAAAYKQIMDSRLFQDVLLPRKATQLASRLTDALTPLFVPCIDTSEGFAPETREEWSATCTGLQFRFFEMFQTALKFKAATVLTQQRFAFVVHAPGTSHISNATTDTTSSSTRSHRPPSQNKAESWLHATMNVYDCGQSNPMDQQSDALIQPINFISLNAENQEVTVIDAEFVTIQKEEELHSPCQSSSRIENSHILRPMVGGESAGLNPDVEANRESIDLDNQHDTPCGDLIVPASTTQEYQVSMGLPTSHADSTEIKAKAVTQREILLRDGRAIQLGSAEGENRARDLIDIPLLLECDNCRLTFLSSAGKRRHTKDGGYRLTSMITVRANA